MKQFLLCMLFALSALYSGQATTLTITGTTAEVVTSTGSSRTFYRTSELMFIYKAATGGFEAQIAETRSKVFGGIIDSVTITGASSATLKLAKLRVWAFESTTTSGYRSFFPRNGLKWNYTASSNVLKVTYSANDQMLWFGSIDSFQVVGLSGASAKLNYLRATANRQFSTGLLGAGPQGTVAAGAALGTSPTISIDGDAISGEVTFTTGGTTTSTGVLFTVTFPVTAPNGMTTVWSTSDPDSGGHVARLFGTNATAATFELNVVGTALTASGTQYKIKYINVMH